MARNNKMTAVAQLIDYMRVNRHFIGNDLRLEFQRFLLIEEQDLKNAYAQGTYDEGAIATEDDCNNYFKENFTQE
tara:strand:- start:1505 stop:1729 length:225 start_codon:yes stop_codon:yes gene_type:complete